MPDTHTSAETAALATPAPPAPLNPSERSRLRAAAHGLRPVVLIGERGLSAAVLAEIDRALTAHQLIKVRAGSQERAAREAMLTEVCAALACQPVHHLGKVLILYRPAPDALLAPAKRKASEPYTTKKRAAAGKSAPKKTLASKTPERPAAKPGVAARFPASPAKPARRSHSALTLRAGARTGAGRLTRTLATRKPAARSR